MWTSTQNLQAVDIINEQHKALDWCIQQFIELGMQGKLPQTKGAEYYEVLRAHRIGADYIAAMGAPPRVSAEDAARSSGRKVGEPQTMKELIDQSGLVVRFRWWLFKRISDGLYWICPEPHKTYLQATWRMKAGELREASERLRADDLQRRQ